MLIILEGQGTGTYILIIRTKHLHPNFGRLSVQFLLRSVRVCSGSVANPDKGSSVFFSTLDSGFGICFFRIPPDPKPIFLRAYRSDSFLCKKYCNWLKFFPFQK